VVVVLHTCIEKVDLSSQLVVAVVQEIVDVVEMVAVLALQVRMDREEVGVLVEVHSLLEHFQLQAYFLVDKFMVV
jgi:hypothetical protein